MNGVRTYSRPAVMLRLCCCPVGLFARVKVNINVIYFGTALFNSHNIDSSGGKATPSVVNQTQRIYINGKLAIS